MGGLESTDQWCGECASCLIGRIYVGKSRMRQEVHGQQPIAMAGKEVDCDTVARNWAVVAIGVLRVVPSGAMPANHLAVVSAMSVHRRSIGPARAF